MIWSLRRIVSPTVLWIAVGHVGVVLLTFAVAMAQVPPAARADLAPTGKLRAGVNYGNFILAVKDVATGESRGVAIELFTTGKVEALAGLRQGLIGLAAKHPGSRILDGQFFGVQQAVGVPKGREAGVQYLRGFVEEAKASGLVARAIERTGAHGVSVAPKAPAQ